MNRIVRILIGLGGLSFVILIHEMGHFIACKIFNVGTPLFSIGFGPRIVAYRLGSTLFQIALLPIGGFVAINQQQLELQPYAVKAIILLAGIAVNFAFAWAILLIFRLRHINVRVMIRDATAQSPQGLMGPIGIIGLISYSASLSMNHFLLVLAGLSMSIGMFNLLPVPFFDGGQLLWVTIEAIAGPLPDAAYNYSSLIFFGLFLLFILFVSFSDIRKLRR